LKSLRKEVISSSRRHFLKTTLSLPLAAAPAVMTQSASAGTRRHPPQLLHCCPDDIDIAWSMGIRCFDSADWIVISVANLRKFRRVARQYPERRKEIFFVSKDYPRRGLADARND